MKSILADAFEAFNNYSGWIVWNLFLAFIPLMLSLWLFLRPSKERPALAKLYPKGQQLAGGAALLTSSRSLLWWIVFIVYITFLPNAPYLLTDIIHLIEAIRAGYSIWITTLVFIPLHLLAISIGWEAYVISLINQGYYLKKQGARKFIFTSELITHALCAIGIFLGRFRRFNSWDLVTQPDVLLTSTIGDLTAKKPLLVILITFIILFILYWLTKQITLGTILRIKLLLYSLDPNNESK